MKKIFVMGGGGFAMEPENLLLDHYILSLSAQKNPKVCFLGTASGDSETYRDKFYAAYQSLPCEPSHFSVFRPSTRDIESFILEKDIIHVGGGNTKNLLCLWREWNLDAILRKAYDKGVVLSGMSAGMLCWFEQGVSDSFGVGLEPLPGLGLLKGAACPHFDGEADRRPAFQKFIKDFAVAGGLALDDGAGALYIDGSLSTCVSSRKNAGAYLFESQTSNEQRLPVKYLGV